MRNIYNSTPLDGAYIKIDPNDLNRIKNILKNESLEFTIYDSFIDIIINGEIDDTLNTIASSIIIDGKKLDYEDMCKYKNTIMNIIKEEVYDKYTNGNILKVNLELRKDIYLKTTRYIYKMYDKRSV